MLVRMIAGLVILVGSVTANIILIFSAAAAAGLDFWGYIILNKLGIVILVWNYSPLSFIAVTVATIFGIVLVKWDTYR